MASKLSEWLCARRGRERLARELRVAGGGIAADDTVATGPLGDIERLIGRLDQGFAAVAIAREDRDPQAEGEVGDGSPIQYHGLAGDRSPNPFGHHERGP